MNTIECDGCAKGFHHWHTSSLGVKVGQRCHCGQLAVTQTIATNGTTQRFEYEKVQS